ncbi:MAG: hypothetical protein H6983_02700 [Ectothiorhodospiraceae bacterium]|nr:hypothetical protein [Ectothiorhodospiraceae bacterium]
MKAKWTRQSAPIWVAVSVALAGPATAGTGLCISDPAFGSDFEINILACQDGDCLLQLDRPTYPATPIGSTGALTVDGSVWHVNWTGAYTGETGGTIHVACAVDVAGGLPASGLGMLQRFTPGERYAGSMRYVVGELHTGQCTLQLCPPVVTPTSDPLTGR